MYKHLFLVRRNIDEFSDKRFIVDAFITYDWSDVTSKCVAARLAGGKLPLEDSLTPIRLRAQFNNDITGPLLVNSEEEMSLDDIEAYINTMNREQWSEFARNAKC